MTSIAGVFGQNIADLLDTEHKQRAALDIFRAIEQKKGTDAAREWMIERNPDLRNAAPIRLIAWDCVNDVAFAANAYLEK